MLTGSMVGLIVWVEREDQDHISGCLKVPPTGCIHDCPILTVEEGVGAIGVVCSYEDCVRPLKT